MTAPRHPGPLPHRVRPADGEAAGTLVLLHGRGADEHDLFGLFDVLDPERRLTGVTVGGPLALPPGGRHWYVVPRVGFPDPSTFGATFTELASLLDDELGLDWSRTVVGGFSQGSVMSYALGLGAGRPSPAGVLAMSGFIPTTESWTPDLEARKGLPVFIAHGTLDPVISVEFGRDAAARLRTAGAEVTMRESAMAHQIDPRVIPDVQQWLTDRFADRPTPELSPRSGV
jgi:phospholipase/carboxylesterase